MEYSPKQVANALLELQEEKGLPPISPMKLQKLVYFAHGWFLALAGKPLISESIQAWDYGPVVESLYHDVKHWGSEGVAQPITELSFIPPTSFKVTTPTITEQDVRTFLTQILDIYGKYTAIQLSNMTHMSGTPWSDVRTKFPEEIAVRSLSIPNELIQSYFVSQKTQ
jgi:uncharacterized phage-associated protein